MSTHPSTRDDSEDWEQIFYQKFEALAVSAFPKHCNTCGKAFETPAHFLHETSPVHSDPEARNSGLFALAPTQDPGVGLLRNCTCGSTLMVDFHSRRDTSPEGQQRRELFEHMLDMLQAKGLSNREARETLLDIFNGRRSAHTAAALTDIT